MKSKIFLILFFLSMGYSTWAQIFPSESVILNYRIVGFSVPSGTIYGATPYKIQVVRGHFNDNNSFKKQHIISGKLKDGKVILELPAFNTQYTWRVIYNHNVSSSVFNHFSTGFVNAVDTAFYHLRITKAAEKYSGAYILIDENGVLYDMKGQPLWYLPSKNLPDNPRRNVFDLKISPFNTLTMISNNNAEEIDYDGKILWQAPDDFIFTGDSVKHYHHQFNRLDNGHYMVLTNEFVTIEKNSDGNKTYRLGIDHKNGNNTGIFDVLVEFDAKGKVVWSWRSSSYFKEKWEKYLDSSNNIYQDTHANAFAFDEKKGFVYISFKNTSQVIKIAYPEGKVVAAFDGQSDTGTLFGMQHACNISQNGNLCLFNNNIRTDSRDKDAQVLHKPEVLVLKEEGIQKKILKKIWYYVCPIAEDANSNSSRRRLLDRKLTIGGNIIELQHKDFFVSTCMPYNNIFIIDKSKKVLWEAVMENREKVDWYPFYTYRASLIANKETLEKLIWNKNGIN